MLDRVIVVDRVEDGRLDQLVDLFAASWWASGRGVDDARAAVTGSAVVVGLVDVGEDRLVGFARALTDGRFLAVICDVIVAPERRGESLGARLMDEILARPELAAVDSVELVCQPEHLAFYRRWGFTDAVGASRLMRRSSNPLLIPPA